jgi:hypothetical protein
VYSYQESLNYTVILKVNHEGHFNFTNHTLLDPDCGSHCRYLLLDHVPLTPSAHVKDFLALSQQTQRLVVIKNYDPLWVYLEITPSGIVTSEHYLLMETMYSGLNFHMYLVDYDGDGYIDVVYPDQIRNQMLLVRNPGPAYWLKLATLKDKYAMA